MSEKNRLGLIKMRKQAVEDNKTMSKEKFKEKYMGSLTAILDAIDVQIQKELKKVGADKGVPSKAPMNMYSAPPKGLKIKS